MHRVQLLPAAVEVLVAAGELDEAVAVAAELRSLADHLGSTAVRARAHHARGQVQLGQGAAAAAVVELRTAARLWSELGAPYENARARALVGGALRDLGDVESGAAELTVAHDLEAVRRTGALAGLLNRPNRS